MKNFPKFLNEIRNPKEIKTSPKLVNPKTLKSKIIQPKEPKVQLPTNIKTIPFSELQEQMYVRLYYAGETVGNFRIEQVFNSNPQIIGIDSAVFQKINDDGSFDIAHGNFVINAANNEYAYQPLDKRHSVGIVFIYNGKILLVNNIGKGYTHPKGNAKPGEKYEETASREVQEEVGINYPSKLLSKKPIHSLQYFGLTYLKTQYFYIVHLSKEDYKRYFGTEIIPKENLQADEVDWARFVPIEKCRKLLQKGYDIILKYVN